MTSENNPERDFASSNCETFEALGSLHLDDRPSVQNSTYVVAGTSENIDTSLGPGISNEAGVGSEITSMVDTLTPTDLNASPIAEHPMPKSIESNPSRLRYIWRAWALELGSISLGILTLIGTLKYWKPLKPLLVDSIAVAIAIILVQFDQQAIPKWPLGITLNTLVAFLAIIAKAAFMLPVSVAISQAQWSWFLQERPLYDFHVFDQASRGTWGSLIFLFRINMRHFSSIGAFLTVVSIVSSPITQLTITYPIRNVHGQGEANIGVTRSLSFPTDNIDDAMYRGIILATAMDTTRFSTPISAEEAICSTGNCTFEPYSSLGICMKMANVSSQLKVEQLEDDKPTGITLYDDPKMLAAVPGQGKIWKASLPNGIALVHQKGFSLLSDSLDGNVTLGFQDDADALYTRVMSAVLIFTKPITQSDPSVPYKDLNFQKINATVNGVQYEALEFLFHLCVQSYTTNVDMGKENTNLISSTAQPLVKKPGTFLGLRCDSMQETSITLCDENSARLNETLHLQSPHLEGDTQESTGGNIFGADYRTMERIAYIMRTRIKGYAAVGSVATMMKGQDFMHNLKGKAVFSNPSLVNATERDTRIRNMYTNVATLMSSQIRSIRGQKFISNSVNITGKAWKEESYISVSWGWISFLAVEIAIAAGFLAITINSQLSTGREQDKKVPVFGDVKDSSLAQLVALGDKCRESMGQGLGTMDELEKAAKSFRGVLIGHKVVPTEPAPTP